MKSKSDEKAVAEASTQEADEAPVRIIRPNPVTGQLEASPPQVASEESEGEESFFTDDGKSSAPTTFVLFRGKRVEIRELNKEQKEHYNAQLKKIEEAGTKAQNLMKSVVTPQKPQSAAAQAQTQRTVEQITNMIPATQLELDEWVIETTVRKWELPRPYSIEEAKKLHRSMKAELANMIVAKSQMGRTASDFLSAL